MGLAMSLSVSSDTLSRPMMRVSHPAATKASKSASSLATFKVVSADQCGNSPASKAGCIPRSSSSVKVFRDRKLSSTTYRGVFRARGRRFLGKPLSSRRMLSTGLNRKDWPLMSGTLQKRQVKGHPRVVWAC